jgi:hypothetical protein
MEQVSKFVEDGFHFGMGQEGGLVPDGLGHVATNEAEVGFALLAGDGGAAGLEVVHPGPASLAFAWMPVGVEGPDLLFALGVVDLVEGDIRIPDLDSVCFLRASRFTEDAVFFLNRDAEKSGGETKEAFHDPGDGEVGAKVLIVEIVEFLALFLHLRHAP